MAIQTRRRYKVKFAINTLVQRVDDKSLYVVLGHARLKPSGEIHYIYRSVRQVVESQGSVVLTNELDEIRTVSEMENGAFEKVSPYGAHYA